MGRLAEAALARQVASGLLPAHTELSPRPDWVPAWDSLSADERLVYARYMEAFAGFLSHTDAELGRLFGRLAEMHELDDTSWSCCPTTGRRRRVVRWGRSTTSGWNVLPQSVEEAAARIDEIGGPRIHNNYPWGWTVAGNTRSGAGSGRRTRAAWPTRSIVHWPRGIAATR